MPAGRVASTGAVRSGRRNTSARAACTTAVRLISASGSPTGPAGGGNGSAMPTIACSVLNGISALIAAAPITTTTTTAASPLRDRPAARLWRRVWRSPATSRSSASRSCSAWRSFASLSASPLRSPASSRASPGGSAPPAPARNIALSCPPVRPSRRASCPMARPAFSASPSSETTSASRLASRSMSSALTSAKSAPLSPPGSDHTEPVPESPIKDFGGQVIS